MGAPVPGGGLIAATGRLDVLDAAGMRIARVGRESGSPAGDGGPAANARLFTLGVAAADDGSVLASDFVSRGFRTSRRALGGGRPPARLFGVAGLFRLPIRAFVPLRGRPARSRRSRRRRLRDPGREGAVAVERTFAGRATVVVTRRGEEVARAAADVAAGRSSDRAARGAARGRPDGDGRGPRRRRARGRRPAGGLHAQPAHAAQRACAGDAAAPAR